jgi:DNA transposition AAA+ family ATPase
MSELTLKEKDAIRGSLSAYCERYPSRNKATGSLKGVSTGTVSMLLNGKYENIRDEMFRSIASQVGAGTGDDDWQIVKTKPYQYFIFALNDAKVNRSVTWVVSDSGCGKSAAAELYAREHREVFYIPCTEHQTRVEFIRQIAQSIGIRPEAIRLPNYGIQ